MSDYFDELRQQLQVTHSKNVYLEDKIQQIETLIDNSFGEYNERTRALETERSRLEVEKEQLQEELVATKEELLFIRAQLQA